MAADQKSMLEVTCDDLREGVRLPTGEAHRLKIVTFELRIHLDLNPDDPERADDRFLLLGGTDPEAPEFEQEKTVTDDAVEGDEFLDLVFTGLKPQLHYWLLVDPGREGDPYYLFEDMPYEGLKKSEDGD